MCFVLLSRVLFQKLSPVMFWHLAPPSILSSNPCRVQAALRQHLIPAHPITHFASLCQVSHKVASSLPSLPPSSRLQEPQMDPCGPSHEKESSTCIWSVAEAIRLC